MSVEMLLQLILLLPIMTAVFAGGLAWRYIYVARALVCVLSFAALLCAVFLYAQYSEPIQFVFAGFESPYGISFLLTEGSALMAILVHGVGCILSLFLYDYLLVERHRALFLIVLLYLFITACVGFVLTTDFFNAYVFLEVSGLSSYALLAFRGWRASYSALRYLFVGSIGATFFLLSIALFYAVSGSLAMQDIAKALHQSSAHYVVYVASLLCMLGILLKAGLFPFHGWLPGAYGNCHSLIASCVASLGTKVAMFFFVTLFYFILPHHMFMQLPFVSIAVELLISLGIGFAALKALSAFRISRMFSYIIVAEVGYIIGGALLANEAGLFASGYHLIADALMTLFAFGLLYVLSGKGRPLYRQDLEGLYEQHKLFFVLLVYLAACFVGLPFTPGFVTKVFLIKGGLAAEAYIFIGALLFSSLINVIIFYRLIASAVRRSDISRGYEFATPCSMLALRIVMIALLVYTCSANLMPQNIFERVLV